MTPDAHTIQELMLDVGDGHQLYVQEWGNPDASTTYVWLHGGPGAGCHDGHKSVFTPETQRVIFFDQRGAGKSLPAGSLEANTTQHLIADINVITARLEIDKFVIVGGSWGSTLALAYAIEHPERVSTLVLRGIFTGTQDEIDFIDKGGLTSLFFPEVWQKFVDSVPDEHKQDPIAYHGPRTISDDPAAAKESGYAYSSLEGAGLRLDDRFTPTPFEDFDPSGIRIEVFYFQNKCFLPEDYILTNAASLTMPVWLVQGRYDMVCPPITAHTLHQALPDSRLHMVTAGHVQSDRAIYDVTRTIIASLERV